MKTNANMRQATIMATDEMMMIFPDLIDLKSLAYEVDVGNQDFPKSVNDHDNEGVNF